jgi:hypothetical protein
VDAATPCASQKTRAPAHQRSDEKDIRSVYRRRKEATEVLGFNARRESTEEETQRVLDCFVDNKDKLKDGKLIEPKED